MARAPLMVEQDGRQHDTNDRDEPDEVVLGNSRNRREQDDLRHRQSCRY